MEKLMDAFGYAESRCAGPAFGSPATSGLVAALHSSYETAKGSKNG